MALLTLSSYELCGADIQLNAASAALQEQEAWTGAPQSSSEIPFEFIGNEELADRCMHEIERFRRGEPSDDQYGVELFRRALTQRDHAAWEMVQLRFTEVIRGWLYTHPLRHAASYFDSDENYVALTFARFWQATACNQHIEFTSIASILRYLRASLGGAIFDTLHTYRRPREFVLPGPDCGEEPYAEEPNDDWELWDVIRSLLPDRRQRRLAYLLFHCHLKPREIVRFCSDEFATVTEIYRLKRNILDRLLRNADYLRWRLASEPQPNSRQAEVVAGKRERKG